ncbi:MAG: TIGR02270 family protein [Myxococcota bacterium]
MSGEELILWDVVQEHLDEAEFVIELWLGARRSPIYTLQELEQGPEARLVAHVDGLVVNGPLALQRTAWPALEDDDPQRAAAAALAIVHSGDFTLLDGALDDLDPPAPEGHELSGRADGIALALALCDHPALDDQIRGRLAHAKGSQLALLLAACADRGIDPSPALDRALGDETPEVVALGLRAAAFGPHTRLLGPVETYLAHASAVVRAAAIDTALAWGSPSAWERVAQTYHQPDGRAAMVWMACLGDERHAEAIARLLDDEAQRHDALWALGFCGRTVALNACMRWLDDDDERTRRLAAEAIAHALGLDLEDDALWDEEPSDDPEPGVEGQTPDDDDDDLDADLELHPEDELPLPNVDAIRERWAEQSAQWSPKERYVQGKPVGREGLGWTLATLSGRRVDVVAREVVARSQGIGRWPRRVRAHRHRGASSALAQLGRNPGAIQGDRR